MNFLAILFSPDQKAPKQWVVSIALAMTILTLWTVALLNFGFQLPLYLLSMLAISLLVFVTPTAGLPIILLGTMWFQRWFTLEPIVIGDLTIKLYPLDVVILATMAGLLFHQLFGKEKWRIPKGRFEFLLSFFMLLCVIYLVRGFGDPKSDAGLNVSAFKNYAFYGLLYFLVTFTTQRLEDLRNLFKVFLAGGFGLIVFVVIGILRGQGLWVEYNPLSTEGIRLLSFPHAFYLSVILAMTLVLFIYKLRPERNTIMVMWIQLIGVLGSLMRHLWISLLAVSIFVFLVIPRQARKTLLKFYGKNAAVIALFAVSLAFIMMIFPFSTLSLQLQDITGPLYNRARSLARTAADSSARWRVFAWRAAKESFLETPFVGVGYGRELVIDFETYRVVVPMRELHNSYLVLLVQMGLLGMTIFLILLWILFRPVYASWKGRGIFWPYQAACFAGLLIWMSAAFWQPYFETNFTGIFFWILAGMLMVSLRLDEGEVKRLAEEQV